MSTSATETPDDAASPPPTPRTRGRRRRDQIDETLPPPESSENTAYSIDFDALMGGSKDNDDLTMDDMEPVEAVRSEDVDGPSDFTQNMEFWMRARLPLVNDRHRKDEGGGEGNAATTTTPAIRAAQTEEEDAGEGGLLPVRAARVSMDGRDHVSDSEGEHEGENDTEEDRGEDSEDDEGTEHGGSFEYGQSEEPGEDTREVAAAAMQDLEGYVISDEDGSGFSPQERSGSIDEQIDILSSMDDVNEDEYRSGPASPQPPQQPQPREWRRQASSSPRRQRASWLQPTVEDIEETPPDSVRPSPRGGAGPPPVVRVEDFEEKLRKQGEKSKPVFERRRPIFQRSRLSYDTRQPSYDTSRPSYESNRPSQLSKDSSGQESASDGKEDSYESDSGWDEEDLLAHIERLRSDLRNQREESNSRIASLESQLEQTRTERDDARENEQRRVRDLNTQNNDHMKDLEKHWQRRLAMAQERYEQDAQEQKASFALVKSSFESRLSATESGLQAQLAQKEAELDSTKSTHKQDVDQQRAAHDAKVAALEDRVKSLQSSIADRERRPTAQAEDALAQSATRIADLEARLSATQSQLEAANRPASSPSPTTNPDRTQHQTTTSDPDLLARAKSQVADLEAHLARVQAQLALAHRETTDLQQKLEKQNRSRATSEQARQGNDGDGDAEQNGTRDLPRMLEKARGELDEERRARKQRVRALEREVEAAKRGREEAVREVRQKAEEAVRRAGAMVKSERGEKAKLKQALEGVKAEVEGLRAVVEGRKKDVSSRGHSRSQSAPVNNNNNNNNSNNGPTTEAEDYNDDDITTTTAATTSTQDERERLRHALRKAQDDATKARQEAKALREDHATVNRQMDERVVQLVRAREREWRARLEAVAREKKALGRALLHEWGREEVGDQQVPVVVGRDGAEGKANGGQGYRYKFVKRS